MMRSCSSFVCRIAQAWLVLALVVGSAAAQVTPPEKALGFKPGADFSLATYEQAVAYVEQLAKESPRIRVFEMGTTSFGRPQKYVAISSEENLARLDRWKEISRRLSLGRGVSEADARTLADEGKAIVWVDGGLHATEVVGSNQNIQLAYDLVTGEDRRTRLIRDQVVTLIVWVNPDGMTMVADWYRKNVGTSFETSPMPFLYHKYSGHDNNRDSQVANLRETQNTQRLLNTEWFPEIYYNQHQTGPFPARIWISPTAEPTNPNVHPVVRRFENLVGAAGAKGLDEAGLSGALSRAAYDYYYAGSVLAFAEGHNIPSLLTETANYGYATPHFYKLEDFPEPFRDLTPGQFYPNPWKGGWWRFADQLRYNNVVSKSVLELAALYRSDLLFNKWKAATDTIARFANEPPYGWIVPADQRDQTTTALMLGRFQIMGFEVYQADEAFTQEGVSYPKGTFVIPTSQPFGLYVKNLLEAQDFPDLRKYPHLWQGQPRPQRYYDTAKRDEILPPLVPYDNAGWTVPLLMGVNTRVITTPLAVPLHPVTTIAPPAGSVAGAGPQVVFSHADNGAFRAVNRIQKAGGRVSVAREAFTFGGTTYAPGTFIAEAGSLPAATLKAIATATGIPMTAGTATVPAQPLARPRVALYQSWDASMDAGWTTYLFDQYEFPYTTIHDADVRAGNLRDAFDTIVLPDQTPAAIQEGHKAGTVPPAYVGGLTEKGVTNLKRFVEAGGTLVCNKASLDLAVRLFALPITNVVRGLSQKDFFVPGSILRVDFDTTHPVAFGMEAHGVAYVSGAHAFEIGRTDAPTPPDAKGAPGPKPGDAKPPVTLTVFARFPDEPLLTSGFAVGDEKLRGKAVGIEAAVGAGRVILFGFNVQNRAQSYATHKLLYNAVLGAAPGGGRRPTND